jgi:hypothetical protein
MNDNRFVTASFRPPIGSSLGGGKVIGITGNKILIAAMDNSSTGIQWGCEDTLTGAISYTDGAINTANIINNCATRPIAASLCSDLVLNGYNDWYLPAISELITLYYGQNYINDLNGWHWSSTENDSSYARYVTWDKGYDDALSKGSNAYVHCVRGHSE